MDLRYLSLDISAHMILRSVYLILISVDQINTAYKMLALLRAWRMVFLTFKDTDVQWIQVGFMVWEMLT